MKQLYRRKLIKLTCGPDHPTQQQISKAFKDLHEAVCVCFAYDKNGSLHVSGQKYETVGQWTGCIVMKTNIATFHDIYYDDEFLMDQTRVAELQIDQIETFLLRRDG